MSPKETITQASQALVNLVDDKEALKAKMMAMMARRPPGLSAPKPKAAAPAADPQPAATSAPEATAEGTEGNPVAARGDKPAGLVPETDSGSPEEPQSSS